MNTLKQCAAIFALISSIGLSTHTLAAVVSASETFDSGIQDWSTNATLGSGSALIGHVATGGEDGGAYISQTADATFGAFGPVTTLFRCNNQSGLNCSSGKLFGHYEPSLNNTSISFYLRHNAGLALDFFARLAPAANSPGAGTGNDFIGTVTSGVWTELTFDIEPNYFSSFSGTDFTSVFSNSIERLQIGVELPNFGGSFVPQFGVTYDLDSVSLTNTAVPLPAGVWLFGSAIAGLATLRRRR